LDFGIGKGYRHNEFASFRIPMDEAQARFEEAIDIITKSWVSNERFTFNGKFWSFDDIVVEPPAIQRPHPPFWQGAGHPDSIRRVAARGHNLLLDQFASIDETVQRFHTYRDAMIEYGFGFEPHQAGIARAFFVANSTAEKDAAIERRMAAQRRLHDISQIPGGNNTASIMAFSDTREANEEATLFGTPDEIIRKIQRLRDHGVEYILLNGGGTSRENLRRFAREVMPHFKGEAKRRAAE
jgi:alkanesulfonate monooxygenase SsuD/methylene tetrahydromethanopterin reductase-like flavin-dependent oxidoreductase (luciferase family)